MIFSKHVNLFFPYKNCLKLGLRIRKSSFCSVFVLLIVGAQGYEKHFFRCFVPFILFGALFVLLFSRTTRCFTTTRDIRFDYFFNVFEIVMQILPFRVLSVPCVLCLSVRFPIYFRSQFCPPPPPPPSLQ